MKKTNKVLSPTKSDSLASETEEPIRRVLISSKKPSTIRDHHIIDNFDLKISENEQILFIPYREEANNVLCEYIQKEKLGAGTFGVVYRYELSVCKVCKPSSQDLKTNKFQNLAVKIQSMVGEHYYKQKLYENKILEKLEEIHYVAAPIKNLIRRLSNEHYISYQVFEYFLIDLHDLSQDDSKNEKPNDTSIVIVKQMIEAVKGIHEKNILHYDIKLANFLLTSNKGEPLVNLTDFGISLDLSLNKEVVSNGYSYFPPEVQFQNFKKQNSLMKAEKSIDIYMLSLAIVDLLMPAAKGYFSLYTKEISTSFEEIKDEIKRHLSPKEQAKVDLVVGRGIKPKPEDRIKADQLLKEVTVIVESKDVETQQIAPKIQVKRQKQTYANYLKISRAFRN